MTTTLTLPLSAEALYEQFQKLSEQEQHRLKTLVLAHQWGLTLLPASAENEEDDDEDGDTVRISLVALHESIEQVKLLQAGKITGRPVADLLAELEDDEHEDTNA